MSAVPPPPPPPGQPFGSAPAWSRDARRYQRRAAAFQARQQRQQFRAQLRATRRPSMAGPLLLIFLGVAFLLVQLGRISWERLVFLYAHWWPLLLVGLGLILLLEWALDEWLRNRHPGGSRRTIDGGTIFLLVLLSFGGLGAMAAHRTALWLDDYLPDGTADRHLGLERIFAEPSEASQDETAPLAKGQTLSIRNASGSVHVSGSSDDGQVHVQVRRKIYTWHKRDSAVLQKETQSRLGSTASGLELTLPQNGHEESEVTVQMPHEASLRVAPGQGELTISELHGNVTVEEHRGNLTLTALTGTLGLNLRDDNADVTGHSLTGDLSLTGRSGDLSFSDVNGSLNLQGDFFGTTHLERVHGAVRFQSSFTDFACAGIPGELSVEGRSDLHAQHLLGPVKISTSDRTLKLAEVQGDADIQNRNGSVSLALSTPLKPVHIATTDGSVEVSLPEGTSFSAQAVTQNGHVNNDFGFQNNVQEDRVQMAGQVGSGGPSLTLETTEGDISVRSARNSGWADGTSNNSANRSPTGTAKGGHRVQKK